MEEMIKIEELEGEDCLKLRDLWEEVFWEDSQAFTDYYFQEKAVRNHAFAFVPLSGDASGRGAIRMPGDQLYSRGGYKKGIPPQRLYGQAFKGSACFYKSQRSAVCFSDARRSPDLYALPVHIYL